MDDWVRFDLDGQGGSVLVEVGPQPGLERLSRGEDRFAKAKVSWENSLADIRKAATAALGQFREMASPPDEVEIQFGVKLSAVAGALIAKTGTEGHLDIKIKWQRHVPESASSAGP